MLLHALLKRAAWAVSLSGLCLASVAHAEDWLTFGKSVQRNGYNPNETVLNTQTVPGLHQLWSYALTGPILRSPISARSRVRWAIIASKGSSMTAFTACVRKRIGTSGAPGMRTIAAASAVIAM